MTLRSANNAGTIIVNDVPSKYTCSKLLLDLLQDLPDILTVKIPATGNSGYVAASQNAPDSSEALLWVELNGAGVPRSLNYFLDGKWNRFLDLLKTPQWMSGDYLSSKDSLEAQGFVLMDGTNGTTDLTELFVRISSTPVNYSLFAVAFVGRQIVPNP